MQELAKQDGEPVRARDREMLLRAAAFRMASFRELQTLAFPDQHFSNVGRRAEALRELGLVTIWEDRLPKGGHPRYVLPTARGLAWAYRELEARSATLASARLASQILRGASRQALHLAPFTAPPWFPHQRATNAMLTRLLAARRDITWASSLHRPFPNAVAGLPMPQPDFVAVRTDADTSRLLFGEIDRGHEPLATFAHAKPERYAGLAALPDVLHDLTGFRTFEVLVIVDAADAMKRLAALVNSVRHTYGATMFRFTIATWLMDAADGAIWFDRDHVPASDSPTRSDHANVLDLAPAPRRP